MPIYEYQCEKCEKVHEIWQKISEDPVSECPDCGGPVERIISPTAFTLKGSGFYATDYKGGKGGPKVESSAGKGEAEPPGDYTAPDSSIGDGGTSGKGDTAEPPAKKKHDPKDPSK